MDDRIPPLARAYVVGLTAVGLTVLLGVCVQGLPDLIDAEPVVLGLLLLAVVAGEQLPIRTGNGGEVSPSTTFTLALLIAFGAAPAILALALGSTIADVRTRKRADKIAFNVAQYTIALALSGLVLDLTTTIPQPVDFGVDDLAGLLATIAVFFLCNTGSVSLVIALHERSSLRRQLRGDLTFHSVTEVILLGLAPVTVVTLEQSAVLAPLLVLPLLAVHRSGRQAVANERLAGHDGLTGLPNRMLFQDRTDQALELAARDGDFVAVMLLDLDRFKQINDTLGHQAGDAVLREVSARLLATVGRGDTVARLGGDEFSVLVRSVRHPEEAEALAERLRSAVIPPIEVDEVRLGVDVSIGIAWHPEHGADGHDLMQHADIAMYEAKRAGAGVRRYVIEDDENSVERLGLGEELRMAIVSGELRAHFQPQVDLASGRVVGVEALARWTHPQRGPISPGEFIPMAEETGAIVALTWHILEEAVLNAAAWRAGGLDLTVAVNLSARMLGQSDLVARVAALCHEHRLPPANLVLEVTESMVLREREQAAETLEQLAALGTVISIDDFGTGYSSLDYLKRLPVAEVKIDRSFIMGMAADERDRAIVRGTLDLAHALGMRVVAEGVEDAGLGADLAAMGCELAQGFHYSRPVPPAEVPAVVARVAASARSLAA